MTMGAHEQLDQAQAAAGFRGYRYKHGDRPLDGYTIQRAAGRGAFGEVYYAVSDSGREVALKVVQAYEQVELRGISQCMNLKSPHLVSVFDVRDGDHGQPVVIMEYVSGPSLRELLDEAPAGFGTQKAAFFLREIGKGLTYLHDCGIVHRDLKPANIFYENGYVKIGDYGLSKAISASHRSAQTVTVGTLHYMAPEVGAGCYDRSVDIYALGALLYEMLTGQPPFFGVSPAEVLMKHLNVPVNVDGIEEPFATVIRKALAKDPNERYRSVQEMVEGVFGSEHVRQSVSCFAPTSLTVVAGRVANHAGLRGGTARAEVPPVPMSSRAYDVIGDAWATANGLKLARRLGRRIGEVRRSIGQTARRWAGRTPRPSPAVAAAAAAPAFAPAMPAYATDPLPSTHRKLLSLIAVVAIAVAAGAFADRRNPLVSAWFALLGTLGATLGIRLAARRLLPQLGQESRFVRHLAGGGLGAAMMLVVALPAWVVAIDAPGRFNVGPTLAALCLALLAIDWARRADPTRPERVSLGDLIGAGGAAIATAILLGGATEVVIGILCGTCLAVQIASPWTPRRAAADARTDLPAEPQHPRDPAAAFDGHSGAADYDVAALSNVHAAPPPHAAPDDRAWTVIPTVYSIARRSVSAGRTVVMWPIRLFVCVVSFALVVAAFVLSCLVAFDLPGLLASGRIDPRLPMEIRHDMGIENWPFVWRSIGGAGLFVLGCLALAFLMWVRRSRGSLHMLRGLAGAALMFAAPFILVRAGIDWGTALPGRGGNGWDVWQTFVQGLSMDAVARAAVVLVGAVVLVMWPAGRRRDSVLPEQGAPTGGAVVMAGAQK